MPPDVDDSKTDQSSINADVECKSITTFIKNKSYSQNNKDVYQNDEVVINNDLELDVESGSPYAPTNASEDCRLDFQSPTNANRCTLKSILVFPLPFATKPYRKSSSQSNIKEENTVEPTIVHVEKNLYCEICSVQFNSRKVFDIHSLLHAKSTDKKCFPYYCHLCGKGVFTENSLKRHYNSHAKNKPYKCPDCDKAYAKPSALKSHKRVHLEPASYVCEVCGKAFKDKNYLTNHSIIHANTRPFACNLCDRRFNDRGAKSRHMITHSGVRPYKCTLCRKTFGRKWDYDMHLVNHFQVILYKCDVCDLSFQSTSGRRRHYLKCHRPTTSKEFVSGGKGVVSANKAIASVCKEDKSNCKKQDFQNAL